MTNYTMNESEQYSPIQEILKSAKHEVDRMIFESPMKNKTATKKYENVYQ